MLKKLFTTKNIAGMAVFSALSFVLSLIEIPLIEPYKLDFSNIFVLLGGFMYGPVGGVVILLVKEIIHLSITKTGGVGELANVIVGISFIIVPTVTYYFKKGIKTVITTLIIACFMQVLVGVAVNKYLLLPIFNMKDKFNEFLWAILLLNIIKSVSSSLFSIFLYKKTSFLFEKINLKESKTCTFNVKEYTTDSEEQTIDVAFRYAKTLKRGDVVLLSGDLGAGKTAFMKGIAKYFNVKENVTSPTYAYLNIYGGFIYHYDCYRLSCGEDALNLGLTDYFGGDNICFIEWSENIKDVLPEKTKRVEIKKLGENDRRITL